MSIINSANPGSQINLLCIIYRVIYRNNNKLSLDEISNLCRPPNLPTKDDHQKRFGDNLRFWMHESHQLWRESDESKLVLTLLTVSDTPEAIATATYEVLFAERFDNIFVPKNHDTTPLFRSLGVIMASDQYTVASERTLDNKAVGDLFGKSLPKFTPNDSEKKYVLAYGHFLGFLEVVSSGRYIVDPTRAVRRVLVDLFGDDKLLDGTEFLSRLASLVPLLDGGTYRTQVEARMADIEGKRDSARSVSLALSLALERLRLSAVIELISKSDDPDAFHMQVNGGERSVSSIRLLEGGQR